MKSYHGSSRGCVNVRKVTTVCIMNFLVMDIVTDRIVDRINHCTHSTTQQEKMEEITFLPDNKTWTTQWSIGS